MSLSRYHSLRLNNALDACHPVSNDAGTSQAFLWTLLRRRFELRHFALAEKVLTVDVEIIHHRRHGHLSLLHAISGILPENVES
jgi:hypothetical protein